MALNYNDPRQVLAFKQQQLAQGRTEEELNNFLRQQAQSQVKSGNLDALNTVNVTNPTTPPAQIRDNSLIADMLRPVVEPAVKGVSLGGEALGQLGRVLFNPANRKAFLGKDLSEEEAQTILGQSVNTFAPEEMVNRVSGNLGEGLKEGFKGGLGVANLVALLNPAGIAKAGAGRAVSTIAPQTLLSKALGIAGREGLQGLAMGAAQEDATLGSTLTTGLASGATGGLLQFASPLVNKSLGSLGTKFGETGSKFEMSALTKRLGKPLKSEGGVEILKEFKNTQGLNVKNAGSLLDSAVELLSKDGRVVRDVTGELSSKGIKITNTKRIIDMLDDLKAEKLLPEDKALIASVKESLQAGMTDDPATFYMLKGQVGDRANWSTFDPTDVKSKANIYGKVYNEMNDILDDTLKDNGFEKFRETNKRVHNAIKAKGFAERQIGKGERLPGLGFTDIIVGSGVTGGAGLPAGAGAVMAKRLITSPTAQDLIGQLLQRGGGSLENVGMGQIPNALTRVLSTGAGASVNQPQVVQQIPSSMPGETVDNQMTNSLVNRGILPQAQAEIYPQEDARNTQMGGDDDNMLKLKKAAIVLKTLDPGNADKYDAMLGIGSEENIKAVESVKQMRELYGIGTKDSLALGDKSVGVGGLLARGRTGLKKGFDQDYVDRLNSYKSVSAFTLGILNKAREAGTLNDGEYQVLVQTMPNENSTEKQAQTWFDEVDKLVRIPSKGKSSGSDMLSGILGL